MVNGFEIKNRGRIKLASNPPKSNVLMLKPILTIHFSQKLFPCILNINEIRAPGTREIKSTVYTSLRMPV